MEKNIKMGLIETIGLEIGKELGKKGLQEGLKKASEERGDKETIIYFALFCNFKPSSSLDIASDTIDDIIRGLKPDGRTLKWEKQTFEYEISWDMLESCDEPDESWENDAIVTEEDGINDLQNPLSSQVSGFIFWLHPISLGNRKDIIISAYHILDRTKFGLQENQFIPIMKTGNFIFIVSDVGVCKRVHSNLTKKMNKQKLRGKVISQSISDKTMLLVVPLREQLTAVAVADSFKRWGLV